MENFEKISGLDNEIQAQLLKSVLTDEEIPHMVRSYHDTALDGLFQGQYGWGHIEAPPEYKERILGIIDDLNQSPLHNENG